jgi:glycerol-3-phosphate O-acyltransferase
LSIAFPGKIRDTFIGLLESYKAQLYIALGDEKRASKAVTCIFKDMIKAYAEQLIGDPYSFPSYHRSIRAPFDYYQMANVYIGSLIDFDRSVLRNFSIWSKVQTQLEAGENVILLGNHQSEGDAAFIPLLTEVSHPGLGEKVIYVAGGRVVTDILAKPFSMGKNLLCVISKKHMGEDPSEKAASMKQNLATLKEMQALLNKGGALIWIAPAGGRDRRKSDGTLLPDEFDPQAVEMMRKLGTKKSAAVTHFYPLAMATYDIMPPPATTEKAIGEERIVNYTVSSLIGIIHSSS